MSLRDALQSLSWPARRRVAGQWVGTHPSRLRGRAPELSELRGYRPGDDPRDLDWKLLARRDQPFVRLSEDRATHATWFLMDASASMAFPVPTMDKWQCACRLVQGLGFLAHRTGDPVGVRVVGPDIRVVDATTRRDLAPRLEACWSDMVPDGRRDIAPQLELLPTGVRLVVLSDFLGDEEALRRTAHACLQASGSEVIALHIVSNGELSPAVRKPTMVYDPEDSGCERPLDTTRLSAYRDAFADWCEATATAWRRAGAAYHRVVAEDDPVDAIREVVSHAHGARAG